MRATRLSEQGWMTVALTLPGFNTIPVGSFLPREPESPCGKGLFGGFRQMVCFRAAVLKAKNGRGRLLPLPAPVLFPLCTSQLGTWHRFHWFIKVQLYAKKRLIVNQSKLHRSNGFFRQQFACLHAIYFVAEHVHILPDMCGNEYKFTRFAHLLKQAAHGHHSRFIQTAHTRKRKFNVSM